MTRDASPLGRFRTAPSCATKPTSDYDLNASISLPAGRRLRQAAVLIAVDLAGKLYLTKRSSKLKHHPGQIAFPGGKVDEADSGAEDAALREAEEEIALPRSAVEVIGTLPAHETVTSFSVTPVLAIVHEPFAPRLEEREVAEMFTVPIDFVTDARNFVVEQRSWQGQWRPYYTVPYGPYYIWGATARMLRSLSDAMDP